MKTPKLVQWIFPRRVWAFSRKEPNVYLTFDDGPIPEVTPWVLEVLRKYDAKATFFCIGDNIHKHPEVYKQILAEGHSVGNHTFHHLKGTEASIEDYIAEVEKCEHEMLNQQDSNSKNNLFRPPYGKMTAAQAKRLQDKGYQIVMWDVLSADFDVDISEEKCLQNVLQNIKKGSVVVFHDSLKAEKNLRYVLPKVLDSLKNRNLNLNGLFHR